MIRYLSFIALACLIVSCGPTARFIYTVEDTTAPAEVAFENQSEKAESYEWDFGDGKMSADTMPTHQYLASGNYEITLKATKGKKAKTTKQRIVIEAPQKCLVQLETPYGNMLIELYDSTPKHRDNFLKLAEDGFYDGLLFHRVINGFMIQGGDPQSKGAGATQPLGMGGPGYQVDAEILKEYVHVKGALAAARTGDNVNPQRRSSGSQFYIVQGRPVESKMLDMMAQRTGVQYTDEQKELYTQLGGTPQLDGSYTVFGRVIEGLDIIDTIAKVQTDRRDRPTSDVQMKAIVIK